MPSKKKTSHSGKGQLSEEAYYKFSCFETFLFIWEKEQEYEVEISELEVSLAYSYCPDCVLEQGVRFIEFKDKAYFYTKDNFPQFRNCIA